MPTFLITAIPKSFLKTIGRITFTLLPNWSIRSIQSRRFTKISEKKRKNGKISPKMKKSS